MKGRILLALGFLATIILPVFPMPASADTPIPASKVIISEVKLGGDSYSQGTGQPKDPQEFVTLYNQSDSDIDLTGWTIEYAKTTFDKAYCADSSWISHSVNSSANQTTLSGILKARQASTPIARSLTDNATGSLHLVDMSDKNNPTVQDLVGWGTNAPCSESAPATTPSNGKSIKRYLGCSNQPLDTDNNASDFSSNQPPSPGNLNSPYLNACQQEDPSTSVESPQAQAATCEGVTISEVLPNPAGADSGSEFIELYNPTSSLIPLQGCSLQTTGSSKVFNFSNISLQPGEYHAFYSNGTGLTLPNAAGGTVWLLSPNTELQAVTYQPSLDDDVTWAQVSGTWQATFQPTPNTANVLLSSKPCPEGEERSVDTGYCHANATLTTSSLSTCKEGQERNPETNRCRAIPATSSSKTSPTKQAGLASCKAGQERNPETNRCKSIVNTASASLKPCPAGQERNSSTNRCRKVSSANATAKLATIKDSATGSIANNPHWWLASFAAFGATSYGVYEWRQEVTRFLGRLKTKLPGISGK
jgi:hypothetical protein